MKFLKKNDLLLVNGGYLVSNIKEEQMPVNHDQFVQKQKEAHALVTLANKVKNADFTIKIPVTFEQLRQEVTKEINEQEQKTYVASPTKPSLSVTESLQLEAMKWLDFEKIKGQSDRVNKMLQTFNIIDEFETFGLYFNTNEIVKLSKIYTIEEIVSAMQTLEPHLS